MGSVFGRFLRVSTFGESHGPAVGVIVEGVPAGLELTQAVVQSELDKRKPGSSQYVSQRSEPDTVEILSGVSNDITLGSPIAMIVRNTNQRSKDYLAIADLFRPGHADYTYFLKYGITPQPGGGRSSGRETVGRVAAGAVAKLILKKIGSRVNAYTVRIGNVIAQQVDFEFAMSNPLRCADRDVANEMADQVTKTRSDGDSVGGIIEVVVEGAPQGLGDPVFDKLDAVLGAALLSIGGVKGIEFGDGFKSAALRGSQHNDELTSSGFLSNHSGGILGGISTGQTIVMRLAVKPTASISIDQKTIDTTGRDRLISVKGRHDPCLCPRIAPVAEAMVAITLVDAWLADRASKGVGL